MGQDMPTLNTFIEIKTTAASKRGRFVDSINNFVTASTYECHTYSHLWVNMVLANQPKAVQIFMNHPDKESLAYELTADGQGLKVKELKEGALFLSGHLQNLKDLGIVADFKTIFTTINGKLHYSNGVDNRTIGYYVTSNI